MRYLPLSIILICVAPAIGHAEQAHARFAAQTDLDHVWTITAAALVFLMQGGFLLLEAGQVRSKNSVNVAQKNLMDFVLSVCVFGIVGYMFMFGTSIGGAIGWQPELLFFGSVGDWSLTFFVFQLMFCGTAATIVSGAVAERMTINGYLLISLLIGGLIYPVAGHWAWGGSLNGSDTPWLTSIGFMDYAGSTVVHSVGAWVGLAAIIIIGPRLGKFDDDGNPRVMHGHSPVLSTAGVILLWVGWIGFNGGSMLAGTSNFASVVANTVIAGAAGGLMLMIIGRVTAGLFRPDASINGVLGGLVAITASADVVTSQTAFFIGLSAGIVVHVATWFLESVLKLDDPLGAIPVHGAAGVFGTIAIALFAPEDSLLAGSRGAQLWVQIQGVGLIFVWAFGVAFVAMKVVDKVLVSTGPEGGRGLRVPELHEREGLNQHEHDAPMGSGILQEAMARVASNASGGLQKLTLDYGDDAYESSVLFNRIIDNISDARAAEEAKDQSQRAARIEVENEIRDVVQACVKGDYSRRIETDGKAGFLLDLCKSINSLSDVSEDTFSQIGNSLRGISRGDISHRIEGTYSGTVGEIQATLDDTLAQLSQVMNDFNGAVVAATEGDFSQRLRTDNKEGFFLRLCEEVNMLCSVSESGLEELFATLTAIGEGQLNAQISESYKGSFAKIGATVKSMSGGIIDLLREVLRTGEAVSENTKAISSQTDEIKTGSDRQVSAMEETQGAINELVDVVNEMAAQSEQADAQCASAADRARVGQDLAQRTKQQVLDVAKSAEAISSAVERIESIAKQATMLSFNASVEAARSSGAQTSKSNEGFKVVAQEVRNMSTQTAEAAKYIRATVETVQAAVEESISLVEESSESLTQINTAMQNSSDIVSHLRALGDKQKVGSEIVRKTSAEVLTQAQEALKSLNHTSCELSDMNAETTNMIKLISRFQGVDATIDKAA